MRLNQIQREIPFSERKVYIPSTEGRVIQKKLNRFVCQFVCLFVPGQKSKVKKTFP